MNLSTPVRNNLKKLASSSLTPLKRLVKSLPAVIAVIALTLSVYYCQKSRVLTEGQEELLGQVLATSLESEGWRKLAEARPKELVKYLPQELKEKVEKAKASGATPALSTHVETKYVEVPFGPCTRDPDLESMGTVDVNPRPPLMFGATVDAVMSLVPNGGMMWTGAIKASFEQGELSTTLDLPLDEDRTHLVLSKELHDAILQYQRKRSKWLPRPFVGGGIVLTPQGDVSGGIVAGYGWSF